MSSAVERKLDQVRGDLDLVSGRKGTTKLNGTTKIDGRFRAICFSSSGEVSAMADNNGNTKAEYFKGTGFTFEKGDILVAKNQDSGKVITSITLASGSAVGIDE